MVKRKRAGDGCFALAEAFARHLLPLPNHNHTGKHAMILVHPHAKNLGL